MKERGGTSKCPVCRRFTHAEDCPVRETVQLEWKGDHPDDREFSAQLEDWRFVQVSPELVEILSREWSEPVQVRILDEFAHQLVLVFRRLNE